MRVAAIDIGSNSTRLLVAEVDSEAGEPGLRELDRRSLVTRLGRGVDTSGQLSEEAIETVCATISDYLELAGTHRPERTVALATSAVRDAGNGDAFLAELRERFDLHARTISGAEEAALTWRGANAGRRSGKRRLVFDIGGGSTELILGDGAGVEPDFHTSLQLGVVRHSERFLRADPPDAAELDALAVAVRNEVAAVRDAAGANPVDAIAVAGTPTSLVAMELALDPYDAEQVEGYVLGLERIQHQLSRLSVVSAEQRAELVGLQGDRAPTIVSGVLILIGIMRSFGLERITVSERDILWGAAMSAAEGSHTIGP